MPNPICPFAIRALIQPESSSQPFITPKVAILHRHGSKGTSENVGRWFDRDHVHTESHFSIARDGRIFQFVPVNRRADAQHAGNAYGVSIESEDRGEWEAIWSTKQVGSIVRLLRWLRDEWSIPGRLVEKPGEPGVGYHKQFTEWNRNAHYCPSDAMVRQIRAQILPELAGTATGDGIGETEEDVEQVVKGIQRALNAARFRDQDGRVLVVDGVWGSRTEFAFLAALKAAAERPSTEVPEHEHTVTIR